MSIARHHAEWLSLVEVSGPFLSMPVLLRVFPQGLDAHDPEHSHNLRLAFEEWTDNQGGLRPDPAIHRAWVRFVLRDTLELPDEVLVEGQALPPGLEAHIAEHTETLRPAFAIVNPQGMPDTGKPRLLIQLVSAGQDIDKPLEGARWKASPATRMMELLHATGVRLGLVTNGERWMVVHAPRGETTSFASWYASLWLEEPLTVRAFRSLLSVRRFFGVADSETVEALYAESSKDQQEVTDQLGYQVRKAVEVVVQAIDRIDRDRGRTLLAGTDEKQLYEAALTVMMRLVFLFSAEERGLLLLGDPLYDQHYAVSTLRAQLREVADQYGEEVLERRHDAWSRLLSTFRAVYGGVQHEAMRLPAYGGTLFDPDRFPFLEGRKPGTTWHEVQAEPLAIHNRTVLHLLEALQILQMKVPGGGRAEARRLSFRALDIEQIGHVYEGLLDHTAVRAKEPVLGLVGAKDSEPEIPLSLLEKQITAGEAVLVTSLREQTGRSENALKSALAYALSLDDQRLSVVCENDNALYERVRPFAGLIREDTSGYPVVISEGSVYVTQGSERRSTGTHYTPRSLTEPIVQHTLDPLVYAGMAEGVSPSPETLRSAREILNLKVCDFACGSGGFLIQACRYLSEKLVEAWQKAEESSSGRLVVTLEGDLATGSPDEQPLPQDSADRIAIARRVIADRCLYGVDKNPVAVEMAKLSLWLITMQKDRPFTFLDHAIRCGDSLLGVTSREQIEHFHLDPERGKELHHSLFDFTAVCAPALKEAIEKRRQIESFPVNSIRDAEEKARLLKEAEEALSEVRLIADLIVGAALSTAGKKSDVFDKRLKEIAPQLAKALDRKIPVANRKLPLEALAKLAIQMLNEGRKEEQLERKPFHWALEFPEIFLAESEAASGLDAIISNPPFQGGQKITGVLGTDYRDYLVEFLANGQRGSADLCAYFFLRASELLREEGGFGMLATNTIAQGDTREVGLEQMVKDDCVIPRAIPSQKWPGTANLEVAVVWVSHGKWAGPYVLQEKMVTGITPFLTSPGAAQGKPYRLAANADKSFQGSIVLGMGFILTPDEAQTLIAKDKRNKDVLFPYLNGEDLNSRPDQSPSRWVINFFDWPLKREAKGRWGMADEAQRKEWLRSGVVPEDYSNPVAADYPDCLAIVREKVKPERDKNNRKVRRERWWQFAERAPELYATIAGMERVLVAVQTSKFLSISFESTGIVYSHMTVVFALDDYASFAVLNASWHTEWVLEYCSTLETRLRYLPTDGFETFPFPHKDNGLSITGDHYYTHRQSVMLARQEGLTKIYNRLHEPKERAADIVRLRELHVGMDQVVAAAYGWTDLDLGHDFHETKQGLRFTISESARREVLDRLLRLNHERYEEEVRQGLHDKGKPTKVKEMRKKRAVSIAAETLPLFFLEHHLNEY